MARRRCGSEEQHGRTQRVVFGTASRRILTTPTETLVLLHDLASLRLAGFLAGDGLAQKLRDEAIALEQEYAVLAGQVAVHGCGAR